MTSRREFLKQLAIASAGSVVPFDAGKLLAASSPGTEGDEVRTLGLINAFVDPLRRMPKAVPRRMGDGSLKLHIRMSAFRQRVHSQIPPTMMWGYNGTVPGPVIEVRRGQLLHVEWENQLPSKHMFPVDKMLHGCMPPSAEVRAVVHVHGAHVPSASDGLPERSYEAGKSQESSYPNNQRATTLWYHDHAMGITRLNVAAGLSGMYIIRDDEEDRLHLPSGEYELPLVLQDRTFLPNGSIYYPKRGDVATLVSPSKMKHGTGPWVSNYFGDKILVNGVVWPYVEVEPRRYRIRLLNSSNARFYGLLFENRMEFFQIGSDGGLLPKPIALDQVLLAPAERMDLVVDFAKVKGKSLKLLNGANTPFPGEDEAMMRVRSVMEFRVTKPLTGKASEEPLSWSLPFSRYREQDATVVRNITLTEEIDLMDGAMRMLINGAPYHDPTTEKPKLGSTEIWQFCNTTDDAHPMHLHLSQFQVMDRRRFDQYEYQQTHKVVFVTGPIPPGPGELGWKDTVIAYPGEMVRIIVRFEDYIGKYVYHCHMLEHEDNDMMRPFEVVS